MQFYEINICQVMIFRYYAIYNKHKMIKIDSQTKEKSQISPQVPTILPEIVFMYSTKESENKDAECTASNGKISKLSS